MCHPKPSLSITGMIVAIVACNVFAQRNASLPAQVNGQVRYAKGGNPADQVLVRLESFGGGIVTETTTDRTGKFRFSGLIPDQYNVTVRAPGYKEAQQHVDLRTNNTEYVLFQLEPDESPRADVSARAGSKVMSANVPPGAQSEFEKCEAALASGSGNNIGDAIPHCERAASIYPKFLEAQLRLGTAYMDLGQWDKAEAALRRALEIDPKTFIARFALGEIYLRRRKYAEAEKVLQDGLAIENRSAQAHFTLARVYWDRVAGVKEEPKWRPSLEKSYQEVNLALELDPNLAGAHLLKGNLYFKVRRAEDALREFEEYLRLDPNGQYAEQTRALVEKIKKALAEVKKP